MTNIVPPDLTAAITQRLSTHEVACANKWHERKAIVAGTDCPQCFGVGVMRPYAKVCSVCKGKGVAVSPSTLRSVKWIETPCEPCNGSGFVGDLDAWYEAHPDVVLVFVYDSSRDNTDVRFPYRAVLDVYTALCIMEELGGPWWRDYRGWGADHPQDDGSDKYTDLRTDNPIALLRAWVEAR